jgi:dihydroflavonol-4-reductase
MKKVLVTGGTGFIGSNLSEILLELGYNVRIVRRADSDLRAITGINVEHCIGDVRDPKSLRKAMRGCDTVFHAAAIVTFANRKKEEQYEVNVIGTRNVVEACLSSGIKRLIFTSSIAALGHPEQGELATEQTAFNRGMKSGYKLSKHLAEKEVLAGVELGLDAVIVNPSVVIGERDIHMHGGQLLKTAKRGLLPFYIAGGMNIAYVGDVVRGHISAALKGRKGQRYILGGHNMTHKDIFRRVAQLVGGRPPSAKLPVTLLRLGARATEMGCNMIGVEPLISSDLVAEAGMFNWFSCEKAERELGYTITSFDETVLAAYKWYTEHGFFQKRSRKPQNSHEDQMSTKQF